MSFDWSSNISLLSLTEHVGTAPSTAAAAWRWPRQRPTLHEGHVPQPADGASAGSRQAAQQQHRLHGLRPQQAVGAPQGLAQVLLILDVFSAAGEKWCRGDAEDAHAWQRGARHAIW